MPTSRLPKQALWGFWMDGKIRSNHATAQVQWISTVLKAADIHKMHWFKLAQNHDPTKWDALIVKAFPRKWLTKTAKARLNRWRPGQPSPDNSLLRIRQTRRVWTKPASRIARTECPACEELCPNAHALRTHYRNQRAVTGLTITTIATHTCKECLESFPSAFALTQHECRALFAIPDTDVVDSKGWRPLHVSSDQPHPPGMAYIYGWIRRTTVIEHGRVGFSQSMMQTAPTCNTHCSKYTAQSYWTQRPKTHRGHSATNNTAELTAIAEAFTWVNTEAPGDPRVPAYIISTHSMRQRQPKA